MTVETTTPALNVFDLSVDFGGFRAVDTVSLTVAEGERRAIIGPNGAGKTTLLNAVGGVLRHSEGRVLLFGEDVSRLTEYQRSRLGLARTFQITKLLPQLTVLDNVRLAALGASQSKWVFHRLVSRYRDVTEKSREHLEGVGLDGREEETVANLSHGEQRQLEMALALVTRPRILLLDEPAAGLAPGERRAIQDLIGEMSREITIVMIEHNMDLVLAFADVITVLHQGQVVAAGSPAAIQANEEVRRVYLGGG
jgi:branched-chain amino acid transport system ATP-binding protein